LVATGACAEGAITFSRMLQSLIHALLLAGLCARAQVTLQAAANPTDLVLNDGTPIRLRVTRDVSSANAKPGDKVSFEAADEIRVGGLTIIRKGSPAVGTVTAVQSARRLGRGGKLNIEVDSVQLADGETAKLRRFATTTAGERKGEMAAEVLFGYGPFQLFQEGEEASLQRDTIVTAYVNGTLHLDPAKFKSAAVPVPSNTAQLRITSHPSGAQISVDGNLVGSTPTEIALSEGMHTIRLSKAGCRTWERTMVLPTGQSTLAPTLYPVAISLH